MEEIKCLDHTIARVQKLPIVARLREFILARFVRREIRSCVHFIGNSSAQSLDWLARLNERPTPNATTPTQTEEAK